MASGGGELSHHEYRDTEAWKSGEAKALEEESRQSPDDFTASVSIPPREGYDALERDYYKICLICGWDRKSDKCHCLEEEPWKSILNIL